MANKVELKLTGVKNTNNGCYNIYVLYKNLVPIYVGQTQELTDRLSSHFYTGKDFDAFSVVTTVADKETALRVEESLIGCLKPLFPTLLNKVSIKSSSGIIRLSVTRDKNGVVTSLRRFARRVKTITDEHKQINIQIKPNSLHSDELPAIFNILSNTDFRVKRFANDTY